VANKAEVRQLADEFLRWEVDSIPVFGSITRPASGGPHPAVCFVAGSGPTDRDWNSPLLPGDNGSGRLLASALASEGFVTLRYDKRAAGPYAKQNVEELIGKVSLQSHIDELAGAVSALRGQPHVDPGKIFALTNSEGAIHALGLEQQVDHPPFCGFVLTGMSGRPVWKTMRAQVAAQLAVLPDSERLMTSFDAGMANFLAGRPLELDPALPQGIRNVLQSLNEPANLPFSREIMEVNPIHLLEGVTAPIQIVIGKRDIQVDWRVDGDLLIAAMKGRANVQLAFPETADHVLKFEPTPRSDLVAAEVQRRYNAPERVLDPQALKEILDWLRSHVGVVEDREKRALERRTP
jgi:hypothetical protein